MKKHNIFHIILSLGILSGACLAMPKAAFAQDITTGLVGHWKLDETTGSTIIDSSTTGNDGTWADNENGDVAEETITGQVGNAIDFDGDDVATITTSGGGGIYDAGTTGSFSMSLWFSTTEATTALIGEGNGSQITSISTDVGRIRQRIRDSLGNLFDNYVGAFNTYDDGNWYNLVMTVDQATNLSKVYVNGVELESNDISALTGSIGFDDGLIVFGGSSSSQIIDDVRVYDRALTPEDVEFLYYARPGNLRFNSNNDTIQYFDDSEWIAAGPPKYKPNAVEFGDFASGDQLNQTSNLTGVVDAKQVTGSVWFKKGTSVNRHILDTDETAGGGFEVLINSGDTIFVLGENASGTEILRLNSAGGAVNTVSDWHHLLFSVDLANGQTHLYLDDVDIAALQTTTDDFIDFTPPGAQGFAVGARTTPAGNRFAGFLADLWVDFGTYIDLSVEENRRSFINAVGNPVDLGSDGSNPTGTSPDIFLSGDTDDWHTNKGTGGGFTENGALSDVSFGPGSADVTSGLVGYWNLDESSGTTAVDSAGSNDGTLSGGAFGTDSVTGRIASAISFSNSNDAIDFGSDAVFDLTQGTAAFWFKTPNASAAPNRTLLNKGAAGVSDSVAFFINAPGTAPENQIAFRIVNSTGTNITINSGFEIEANRWYHVAGTHNGSSTALYVDGRLIGTAINNGDWTNISADLIIGAATAAGGSEFDGEMDDVRVYNRVLSEREIRALYSVTGMCASPAHAGGSIIYESANDQMQYCDGENWVPMGPPGDGGAGCSSPAGNAGDLTYNTTFNVMQYCEGDEYISIGKAADPCDDPAVTAGTICTDGTMYAGISPDGNVPMYTTATDEPGGHWGARTITTGASSTTDGDGNSALAYADVIAGNGIDNPDDGVVPNIFVTCETKTTGGHTDWYVPAQDELLELYNNRVALGMLDDRHWSSTENGTNGAYVRRFAASGVLDSQPKSGNHVYRCVRK